MNSRQHWSRQSVAEPLASFAMHAEMSREPPVHTNSETQQPSMLSSSNSAPDCAVQLVTNTVQKTESRPTQKRSRKVESVPAGNLSNHPLHCGPPVCMGGLERSWSAMSLL